MSKLTSDRAASCPDCGGFSRREFLKSAATVAAVSALPLSIPAVARAGEAGASSETLVASFYKTLTPEQKKTVCFPFNDPLRSKVDNNWMIIDKSIAKLFTPDQQAMIREIFTAMHSPEYAPKVMAQVEHDNKEDGGFAGGCAIALFGEPGSSAQSKFEFVLTGRHVTRRCDGNSVEGAAFGGPIFYGHAAEGFNEKPNHPGNAYWYQGLRANEAFKALDGKQRKLALREDARKEQGTKTVELAGKKPINGIPMTELSRDQKDLVRKVMADVLAPFRKEDSDEALKLIEADGGFDLLHMSFFSNMDIGNDGVWDVWQIEGPAMLWYFRGSPHVHTWVHIRDRKLVQA
jgi:hypothetical protein